MQCRFRSVSLFVLIGITEALQGESHANEKQSMVIAPVPTDTFVALTSGGSAELMRRQEKSEAKVSATDARTMADLQEECRKANERSERATFAHPTLHAAPVIDSKNSDDPCEKLKKYMDPATLYKHVVIKDVDGTKTQVPDPAYETEEEEESKSYNNSATWKGFLIFILATVVCVLAAIGLQRKAADSKVEKIRKEREKEASGENDETKNSSEKAGEGATADIRQPSGGATEDPDF